MVHFFKSSALFFLLATATVTANSPHKPGGLRALRNNNNAPAPKRRLEKRSIFHPNSKNRHADRHLEDTAPPSLPPGTFPPGTLAPIDPEKCLEATALEVGATVEGTFAGPEGVWYSVVGTGGYLAASTCTGDDSLDGNSVDTVITVFSGDCDALNSEAQDDDGGSCGGLKSTAYFQTVEGETYHMSVNPYGGVVDSTNNMFGLTVFEVDEPPHTSSCQTAVPLAIDEIAQVETESWFSITGTGGYLAVSTCTEGSTPSETLSTNYDVYSGECDEYNYVASGYSSGDSCNVAYFDSVADEIYHLSVYGFDYDAVTADPFTVTVSEVTELPSTICAGATPLELDQVAEGEISGPGETVWYTLVGTGGDLVISTCTGNDNLDSNAFDSVIQVSAGDCDDLRFISSDDEGGKCASGKSAVILPSVEGLMYKVAVNEYRGETGQFGLKVSEK